MKLSEKLQILRKRNGYTQESLAELLNVSRQAVAKWEANIAVPETEKIILLSRVLNVSTDILLKDELEIDTVKEHRSCCGSTGNVKNDALFEGILIKESIDNEKVLDYLNIKKVELWKTDSIPSYWTALYFTSKQKNLPEKFADVMINDDDNWFVDFKSKNEKYIVFRNMILKYTIGNEQEKKAVCDKCRAMGIPDEQMNWSE